jgi:hypothetical protein
MQPRVSVGYHDLAIYMHVREALQAQAADMLRKLLVESVLVA